MKTISIANFDEFHKAVIEPRQFGTIFRGVSKESYKLVPSFGRLENIPIEERKSLEVTILDEFKRHAIAFLESQVQDDWEWLALAQHNNVPTRLLDWTTKPLVALFFAVNKDPGENCVIYHVNIKKYYSSLFGMKEDPEDPLSLANVRLFRPLHLDAKIQVQGGVFTVHPDPFDPFDQEDITKWVLPAESKHNLRAILDLYGISWATLFPGLSGLGLYLNDLASGKYITWMGDDQI